MHKERIVKIHITRSCLLLEKLLEDGSGQKRAWASFKVGGFLNSKTIFMNKLHNCYGLKVFPNSCVKKLNYQSQWYLRAQTFGK